MKPKGVVAAGHDETAKAAQIILEEGGNAFDAVLAGVCAACIAEPVLASLGGGGFLLAHSLERGRKPVLYDFFVQTPKAGRPLDEVDFSPVLADFGEATQEFHIGLGAMAVPGMVKGLFGAHEELGSMPMAKIVEPAVRLAKDGVVMTRFQEYLFSVVEKIYVSNENCRKVYGGGAESGKLASAGDTLRFPEFADTLDCLAREGEDLFYRGEIASALVRDSRLDGGYLTKADLDSYQLVRRTPLEISYGDSRILTNPPPSTGGVLIAFALEILKECGLSSETFGSGAHLEKLLKAMMLTNEARVESQLHESADLAGAERLLHAEFLEAYRSRLLGRPKAPRGTTHISVVDTKGNAAALTLSNGEGTAYIIPGTGIMMNNMLGEEDINPNGFNQWPKDVRMASMMAPSLIERKGGTVTALGSGGSNRIRTAILQVILNLVDFSMPLLEAIESPRLHYERGLLSIESGFDETEIGSLRDAVDEMKVWSGRNMFFGGVHAVHYDPAKSHMEGAGDSRRAGVSRYA